MMYTHTKEYAYLVGVYLGDGYISKRVRGNCISLLFIVRVIDKDFVETIAKCVKKITGKKYKIAFTKPNVWRFASYNQKLSQMLINETCKKEIIPDWILKTKNKEILKWFIAGFLDSDGFVHLSIPLFRWKNTKKGRRQLTMGFQAVHDWIDDIVKILNKLGVKTGKKQYLIRYKKFYKQQYRYTMNYKSFVQSKCFFKLKRKQKLLNQYQKLLIEGKGKV